MIWVNNIIKFYINKKSESNRVLDKFSCFFPKTGFFLVFGESGSGKTTLLNILSGIDKADFGDVIFDEYNFSKKSDLENTKYRLSNICYYPQEYPFNLEDKVYVFLKTFFLIKNGERKTKKDILKILDYINMAYLFNKKIAKLSAGEKQKLLLISFLFCNTKIAIFDEIFSNLDKESRLFFKNELKKQSKNKLIIVTEHVKEKDEIKLYDGVIEI